MRVKSKKQHCWERKVYQNYLGARLSNSSKNIIVGLTPDPPPEYFLEAFSKTFRTDDSLSPMYFDNNSGP